MISLDVKKDYLDKKTCRIEARRLLSEGSVTGMSELQLAREIFFHALIFYHCEKTGRFSGLKSHADPIDIDDGGDRRFRRLIYSVCWRIPARNKKNRSKDW